MSKKLNKTSYIVTLRDGSKLEACCGPAIVSLGSAVSGYERVKNHVACLSRDEPIPNCIVRRMRAEKRKAQEKDLAKLIAERGVLQMEIDELERRLG